MKYFFGWSNIKYGISELIKMYSAGESFFSKKRIESGIGFAVAQYGMIYFLIENVSKMTTSDIAIWSGVEFAVAGYIINQIQKEKKVTNNSVDNSNSNSNTNTDTDTNLPQN